MSLLDGQVVAAFGRRFLVETADGRCLSCITAGRKLEVVCGDHVRIVPEGDERGVIRTIGARATLLFRSDAFRQKRIAANVTQIVIVVAAEPAFSEELLDRCLLAAEVADIRALIVLNKSDLTTACAAAWARLERYRALGYPLLSLSAHQDVAPLRALLHGHTSVLVGQSGMGKSSLVNALLPEADARIGEISQALDSGRHTTTHARLYHLDADSHLIDSPGLQEFGLHHLDRDAIAHAFVEFRPWLGHCRFNDCRHLVEPGCAVLAAVASGEVGRQRWETYRKLAG